MFGLALTALSSGFREIGTSIGKYEVKHKKESVYTMGFLSYFWTIIILLFVAFVIRDTFVFSLQSLPTFGVRVVLEIAQVYVTLFAIQKASRSTFGFLRIWTIPLLLAVDFLLGYQIELLDIIGISVIVISFIVLFINHGIKKKGAFLTLFTAVNAVATISLYKYNITHFNSVEAEQSIILGIIIIFLFCSAYFIKKENPFRFLTKGVFLTQSVSYGISSAVMSFAYLFAPASIITTAKRSFSILASVLSGHYYFHEKHFLVKLASYALITGGIILIAI